MKAVRLVLLSAAMVGCSTAPTPPPDSTNDDGPIPRPIVTSVSPARGSTGGATPVMIIGSGFELGATVTLGGRSQVIFVGSSTVLHMTTTPQDAGIVEMIVTGPQGQVERFPAAFEFAPPETFDFNGNWEGVALAHPAAPAAVPRHDDMEMLVAISDNVVTSITCAGVAVTLSAPLVVTLGAFSQTDADGTVVVSGRIVSDGHAVGGLNSPACPETRWHVSRKSP